MTTADPPARPASGNALAWMVMLFTPLFFSTNLVFGRWTVPEVAPSTLAFLRWTAVALILSPFAVRAVRHQSIPWRLVATLGALGMVVCGAVVYLALDYTTATNATLIYTTSPVFILLIERMRGVPLSARRALGCLVAILGVATIVFRGDPARVMSLDLNAGDALILLCAIAWAGYSIAFRDQRLAAIGAPALFGLIAGIGAMLLAPFALLEWASGADMPTTQRAWTGIAGIVLSASLFAFSGYQFGLRRFGPQLTGVFMYLLPVYGVALAIAFLGERFAAFHAAGIALVLGGVVLATWPKRASAET